MIKTIPRITAITAPTATPANTPTDNWSLLPEDELLSSVGSGTGVGVSTVADNCNRSLPPELEDELLSCVGSGIGVGVSTIADNRSLPAEDELLSSVGSGTVVTKEVCR